MWNPTHCCWWVAGWLCGFVPGLADFGWVHPCSWIGWGLAGWACPHLRWLISLLHPAKGYSRLFHTEGEMRTSRSTQDLWGLELGGRSSLRCHSVGHSSHKAGPDSKGEGKDPTYWWGELQDHMANGIHTQSDKKLETSLQSICHKYPGILQIV